MISLQKFSVYIPEQISARIRAGRFAFFCLGVGLGIRVSLIPYAKIRLQINDAELGLLLLFLGIGAILPMPLTGKLIRKWGCRTLQNIFIPVFCLSLFFASFVESSPAFTLCAFFMGVSSAILDVVMKVQTALLEEKSKRRLMANVHGMRMVGITVGTGSMALLLQISQNCFSLGDKEPIWAALVVCLAMLASTLYFQTFFISKADYPNPAAAKAKEEKTDNAVSPNNNSPNSKQQKKKSTFFSCSLSELLHNPLFWLGIVSFFSYMISGTLMDWSAVFMHEVRHVPLSQANMGYTLFAVTMTAGRFSGDWLGARFGAKSVLVHGLLFCIAGFLIMGSIDNIYLTYITFFILGFFSANLSPMLFHLVSKNAGKDLGTSIAMVTCVGFVSLMAGPAIMGFVAHNLGIGSIFYALAIFMAMALCILWKLKIKE